MKIIFMGTPEFAVPSLREIFNSEHDVIGVVCQPDKPKGRGRVLTPPPVKLFAVENSIPVLQPDKIRTEEFDREIRSLSPELICVTAYGKIIPPNILEIPAHGCINVHASLLPHYRGAAPINWAIINGETKTGITTMLMDEGMDTGDMLLKEEVEIGEQETSAELGERLSEIGAKLLLETINRLTANDLTPVKQDDSIATYAPIIKKEIGLIDWNREASEIINLIRGTQPWPGAYTSYKAKNLKIFKATVSPESGHPGSVLDGGSKELVIAAGDKSLSISELQIEGGKRLPVEQFLRGNNLEPGTVLGD